MPMTSSLHGFDKYCVYSMSGNAAFHKNSHSFNPMPDITLEVLGNALKVLAMSLLNRIRLCIFQHMNENQNELKDITAR